MTAIIIIISAIMLAGAIAVCSKAGEKEGICDYGYIEK